MKKILPGLALLLALTGCSAASPNSESVGMGACDAFAHYVAKADSVQTMDRKTTVEQVNLELSKHDGVVADQMLTEGAAILGKSVDGPASQWVLAADTFAARCTDAGWTAKK